MTDEHNVQGRVRNLPSGDLAANGIWISQRTGAPIYVADQATMGDEITKEIFLGGSGRNVRVSGGPAGCPQGIFRAIATDQFNGVLHAAAQVRFLVDGSIEIHDGTDVVASAPAGTIGGGSGHLVCETQLDATMGDAFTIELGEAGGLSALVWTTHQPGGGFADTQFVVTYDGGDVIDTGVVNYFGTNTWTKPAGSPTTATVTVTTATPGTYWEARLSCPGNQTPDTPGAFTLAATSYGKDTFNGGTDFSLTVVPEAATISLQGAASVVVAGTFPAGDLWTPTDADHYTSALGWTLVIASDGSATINNGSYNVAIRAAGGPLHDPTGWYDATEYGAVTYNDGVDVQLGINLVTATPMAGFVHMVFSVDGSDVITAATGPHFAPELPTAADGEVVFATAQIDNTGRVFPIHEGPLFWTGSSGGGGGGGVPLVTISNTDYAALVTAGTVVSGTLYNITCP